MNRTCSLLRQADHFRKEEWRLASFAVRTWGTGLAGLDRLTPSSKLTLTAGSKTGHMGHNETRQRRRANTSSSPPQSPTGRSWGISARDSGRPTALWNCPENGVGCGRKMQYLRRRDLRIAAKEMLGQATAVS